MTAVMYFSLRSLKVPVEGALALSVLPFVLGLLDVFASFAYSVSAFILIIACASSFASGYHINLGDMPKLVASWFA